MVPGGKDSQSKEYETVLRSADHGHCKRFGVFGRHIIDAGRDDVIMSRCTVGAGLSCSTSCAPFPMTDMPDEARILRDYESGDNTHTI